MQVYVHERCRGAFSASVYGQHGHGLPAAEFAPIQNYRAVLLDGCGIHMYSIYICHGVGKSKSKHQQLYERVSGVIGVQVEHHLAFFVHVSSKYECERGPGAVSAHSRGILQL